MEFKKSIFIFMLMFFGLLSAGFSADIYLTSCGNSVWNSSNNYYINLTNPVIISGSSCFNGDLNYINMTQLNEKITIKNSTGTFIFFAHSSYYRKKRHNNFYNLNIEFEKDGTTYKNIFGKFSGQNNIVDYNNFYNCSFKGMTDFFYTSSNVNSVYFNYNNFYNCEFIDFTRAVIYASNSASGYGYIKENKFYNTLFVSEVPEIFKAGNHIIYQTNYVYNSVFNKNFGGITGVYTSIVGTLTDTDTNNDNIGDTYINRLMSVNAGVVKHNYTFLQDIKEGLIFSEENRINIPMNTLNLSGSNLLPIGNNKIFDFSFIRADIYSNFFNVQLSGTNSKLLCEVLSGGSYGKICYFDIWGTTISTANFRPHIAVGHNGIEIGGQEIIKQNSIGNGNLIANLQDLTYNNILINNNYFSNTKSKYGSSSDLANNYIKLKVTNLNLNNNEFYVTSVNSSNKFEFLYIDSSNGATNKINLNKFIDSKYILNGNVTRTEVFTWECDSEFYNNYLGDGVVISNGCSPLLNNYVGYPHTDGKIYYYSIGNYYKDNSGCVDSDSDGICDSPYTSGGVTDEKPLSSYPFDFTSHLFTADYIVTPNSYNITTPNLNDGDIANLNSASDGIIFFFSEDSDYPDLECHYILDGVVINTYTSPEKNIIYNYTKYGSWLEKNYTYRVECNNEAQGYITSIEKTFEVTFGGGSSGGNETGGNETGGNSENIFGGVPNLITDDISETASNTGNFIGDFSNGITNLIIPIGFFIVIILVVGGTIALIS